MALNYSILGKKPTAEKNGSKFIDLLPQTIDPNVVISGTLLVVNKYYIARPDLISLAVYGDDRYADIICKINGISNPFELNEDDVLVIPNIETIMDMLNVSPQESVFVDNNKNNEIADSFMDTELQVDVNSVRSPNEQIKGTKNVIVDEENGLLLY